MTRWPIFSGPAEEPADRPYWEQRGWRFSAGFLAVVLVAAGAVLVRNGTHKDAGPSIDARRAVPAIGVEEGSGRPPGCRTDDSDQHAPVQPPHDVTWRPLNGAPVPLSKSAGPRMTRGPLLWCFARTPTGAVMAANVIPRQLSGRYWNAVTDQQVVPGAGRDIFVAMRSTVAQDVPQYTAGSLAGFLLISYSDHQATVRLLVSVGQVSLVATDYTVVWSGGDWKVQPLSTGDLSSPVVPVASPAGFILWKV
ncbi:hypothetical protein ACIA5C_44935 [Actinoplanes sp. NPDC051343]|uniref:hypothetical protein n=1 Tax=Actinoplanes sp. NPDC051343 TaxID=3363906 RepID=UPI0037AE9B9F